MYIEISEFTEDNLRQASPNQVNVNPYTVEVPSSCLHTPTTGDFHPCSTAPLFERISLWVQQITLKMFHYMV